jgi:hypothetical protein
MEKTHSYQVRRVSCLTEEELVKLTNLATQAFIDDPVFCFIFKNSKELYRFLYVCIKYYLRSGLLQVAYDVEGKACGMALWNEPGGKLITVTNVISSGMLGAYLKLLVTISPMSVHRMLKMSDLTQEGHLKESHWYLFLLASFQNGAGSAIVGNMTAHYADQIFYLENSKPVKNAHFYHKHGFEDMPCLSWKEGVVAPMVKRPTA